jgi:eukaryotic-like serine/threonine-protein kinase
VTLWQAAVGANPFEDRPGRHPQLDHRAAPVGRRRRLPRDLAALIDGSLDPDPRTRPDIDDFRAATTPE